MLSDLSYNAHQMMFKLSEPKVKLSYSEVKSFIRDLIYEKWNRHYIAYPAGGQYIFLFPNLQNVSSFQSKETLLIERKIQSSIKFQKFNQTSNCSLLFKSASV